jgi:signal transduction histidine kinase
MTTVRKRWLKILLTVGLLAIIITTLIFGVFMRRFFINFTEENYSNQVENIKNQAQLIFEGNSVNKNQLRLTLEDYLDEPISNISVLDPQGRVLITVGKESNMMRDHMQRMMGDIDTFEMRDDGELVGILRIQRTSPIQNSLLARRFTRTLLINSVISGLTVLILLVIASFYISREMSSELIKTAEDAKNADSEVILIEKPSKVKEIFDIQYRLSQLSKQLKLKEKLRKEAIDSIVHQSQTPLTVLRSNLEALLDEIITPDEKRFEILMSQVDQLILLLNTLDDRILTLGESINVQIKEIDLYKISEKLVKGLELKFEQKGLTINYDYSGDEVINSDESLLVQIIYNLVNNAYKYTDEGSVDLTIDVTAEAVKIEVADTGRGIDKSNQDKIFDAYYREHPKTNDGQGLGLYIVKKNVEAFHGSIDIISTVKHGTKISISLPRGMNTVN